MKLEVSSHAAGLYWIEILGLQIVQAPVEMSRLILPTNAPCINVPDWFVNEGGELCISETKKGYSILRYWPHFLNESGNEVKDTGLKLIQITHLQCPIVLLAEAI